MHCSHCYKDAQFKCGSCLESGYCSKDCQKLDWLNHKLECELVEGKNDLEDKEDENEEPKRSKTQEEQKNPYGCHNDDDLILLNEIEEDHFDMFLGGIKYCFNFDSLVEHVLNNVMDENKNPNYDKFHLGDPNCIRLLINNYDTDSALWPNAVIGGLDFTVEILTDLANQYEIYLSKYPEKRYQKYIITIGLIDYDDILYSENVKIVDNDIQTTYNNTIEDLLKEIRKNGIPSVWIEYVNVNYRLIEKNDKYKNLYSVVMDTKYLEKSLKRWTRSEPFVVRLNFKLQKLPNLIVTLLLPDLNVQRIAFDSMIFFYFVKKMFDSASKDLINQISEDIFEDLSDNYIGKYKLSILFDYDVKVPTIELLKSNLSPNANLKNLESWKSVMSIAIVKLKNYYIDLANKAPMSWLSMASQKEWELLIRINSQSI